MLGRQSRAVIEALLPSGGPPEPAPGALEAGFERFYDEFARTADAAPRRAFRAALFAASWIAPLLIRRPPPIATLSERDRERALEAMATSPFAPFRQLVVVLKTVVSLSYGADARVRDVIGYR